MFSFLSSDGACDIPYFRDYRWSLRHPDLSGQPMELATSRFIGTTTTNYRLPCSDKRLQLPTTNFFLSSHSFQIMFYLHWKIIGGYLGVGWAPALRRVNQNPGNPQQFSNGNRTLGGDYLEGRRGEEEVGSR